MKRMISRRKMTSVLAGVSLTALIVGIGEVRADPTELTADVIGNFILVDPTDYFATDGFDVSGNVINDTVVGPDPGEGGVSIRITDGSIIGGDLINNVTAQTYVEIVNTEGSATATDVAGIEIDGILEGDLINNGTVSAEARAIGRNGAKAEAHGIEFDAEYENAIANVQNNAGALIAATAFASVTGTYITTAIATAEAKGIDQWVTTEDTDGEALVGNSGIITADAMAVAGTFTYYAFGDSAFATATGVEQEVVAGANAAAGLTNGSSGTISAMAQAFAQGSYVQTSAVAHAEGVSQDVLGSVNSIAEVVNQGGISASALAYASSFEDAPATARAVGIDQDVVGGGLVDAFASNAVGATIAAKATATAIFDNKGEFETFTRSITAKAFASGIDQSVSGATYSTVNAIVQNGGTITADANAYATGRTYGIATEASAEANAVGVRQLGKNEEGLGTSSLTNSASGSIVATANAVASGGYSYDECGEYCSSANIRALAQASGVHQFAATYASYSEDLELGALAEITNNGTIRAVSFADASASSGGAAGAYASAFGARQYAEAEDGDATVTTTNTASNSIEAYSSARAIGDRLALADAAATGDFQSVSTGSGNALASLENTGAIFATALAYANASGGGTSEYYYYGSSAAADSVAAATGVKQLVVSSSGDVTATLNNGGTDIIGAKATATAYATYLASRASATGTATGVHQSASTYSGTVANAIINNDGTIVATVKVHASVTGQQIEIRLLRSQSRSEGLGVGRSPGRQFPKLQQRGGNGQHGVSFIHQQLKRQHPGDGLGHSQCLRLCIGLGVGDGR